MSKDINPQAIPKAACTFQLTEFELGDNGENAKTAPIRMLARSSKPIEHWYWGKVAHDVNGFNLNGKNRIPIDFDHNTGEAVGFINRFEATPEGLVLSGTLVSHYEGDRADKIMKDQRAGIPYESSINFGGDGIEIERVRDGESATVNGYELAGEATIVRKWPLRGVAVTLYGADGHTNSKVFSDGDTVSASIVEHKKEAGDNMSKPTELAAEAIEAVEPAEAAETVANPVELSQTVEAVEAEGVEPVEAEAAEVEEAEQDYQFSAEEFSRLVTEFGAEVAAATVTNHGNYTDALRLAYEARGERIAELESRVSELSAKPRTVSTAVAFADGETSKTKKLSFAQALQDQFNQKVK